MTEEEKGSFDKLSDTSYLFRIVFLNAGFDLSVVDICGTETWHLYYKSVAIGAVTFRYWDSDEDTCTFTNLRLYKRFAEKCPMCEDFLMSDYFIMDGSSRATFDWVKFEKYSSRLLESSNGLVETQPIAQHIDTVVGDSISRLREFCDEFDDKFSSNTMFRDVKFLLEENKRLEMELKETRDSIMNTFLRKG